MLVSYLYLTSSVMNTPNLTGPSGKLSSLLRQKTNSSIHGNPGPVQNCNRFKKNDNIIIK